VVGDIPAGLQVPSGDFFQEDLFVDLASAGLVLGVVIYVMTISVGNSLGHKHGYRIQVKQEMLALSAAHLLTPFFGCFPCSASLSRSALAATLGPKTPMHNAFSSLLLILVVYLITPAIRTLPNAALGAIVVFAVRNMLNFKEPKQLYRLNRTDFGLWLCAFTGTLFGGVIIGIGISVSVSVVWLLQKNIRPKMAVLGVLPGTTIYRYAHTHTHTHSV
jgi:MFS superfamily sulfate permease-like transporter